MTKDEFFKKLKSKDLTKNEKIEVCQYFIDNYPVLINSSNPFSPGKIYTKLQGLIIDGGPDKAVNFAFEQLSKKAKELKKHDEKLD